MNGIVGFSTLLINPGLSKEKQKDYAGKVQSSCTQLLNIVNDTVEISKVHSRQAKNYNSQVNINVVLSETINEFKEAVLHKGVKILNEINFGTGQLIIQTDKNKIKRILWHLIDNAVKFTYSGHIKIVGNLLEKNHIQFKIEDTGIGIPEELHDKIFDAFRQEEIGTARNFGGNGIGLSLAKAYVELLGGKIWLQSEENVGTTIFLTIPGIKSNKNEVVEAVVTAGDIDNRTVLVAEDNEMNYILLEEILSSYSLKLLHARNGEEAISIFKAEKSIDLILMDLKMPVMDGYEALKKIKQINSDVPIIAHTAFTSDADKEEIGIAGFNGFVPKPTKENVLMQIIKQSL